MGAAKPTEGGVQGTVAPVTLARNNSGPKGVVTKEVGDVVESRRDLEGWAHPEHGMGEE